MAAVKVTPPNDFPLGLIRSHMVVIHLILMLGTEGGPQRVVRNLCPTLYITSCRKFVCRNVPRVVANYRVLKWMWYYHTHCMQREMRSGTVEKNQSILLHPSFAVCWITNNSWQPFRHYSPIQKSSSVILYQFHGYSGWTRSWNYLYSSPQRTLPLWTRH
jgi:hypothetical protein